MVKSSEGPVNPSLLQLMVMSFGLQSLRRRMLKHMLDMSSLPEEVVDQHLEIFAELQPILTPFPQVKRFPDFGKRFWREKE